MGRKTKLNKVVTDDLLSCCNSKNLRLKKDFLDFLRSTMRSPGTIYNYGSDLNIFFVWLYLHCDNKYFVDVTKRDIIAFQNWLISENENSPSRVRRIKSTLSSLENYIENILDDEYPNYRPIVRKIEDPVNVPVREKTVLSKEQVEFLLNELVRRGREDIACCVALAAFSGRRKSELVLFKIDYFSDENVLLGSLYKTPEKIKTKGRGLGKFLHCYVLKHQFDKYLNLWMKKREQLGIKSEWLFVVKHGNVYEQATISTLNSWAQMCSRILKDNFYFHSLRHFFTTYLSDANIPDTVIQEIIGWSSGDMVKVYVDTDVDENLSKYFDENGIREVEAGKIGEL